MKFQHCPVCGAKESFIENENKLDCKICQFQWYQNPKPVVNAILINSRQEILLAKRKFEPSKDSWSIVGGFLENQESFEQALKREVKEEINLEIDINKLIYLASKTDRYLFNNWNYHTSGAIFVYFLDSKSEQKIVCRDDVKEIKSFAVNKIPWQNLAFASTETSLKIYLEKFWVDTKSLEQMRKKIDVLDRKIIKALAERQNIVKLIGQYKSENKIDIYQENRWQEVIFKVKEKAKKLKLEQDLVENIWEIIHQNSIKLEKF